MLNEFLFTEIEEEDIGNIWFQQDVATCHTAYIYICVSSFLCIGRQQVVSNELEHQRDI